MHGVEDVLDLYFRACSINVTVVDLARIAHVFANGGMIAYNEERIFPKEYARYVNAVLMTCGMYDGSGEFALTVGVPAKSVAVFSCLCYNFTKTSCGSSTIGG